MNRVTRILVAFSVAFTVFIVGPAMLSSQFGPYPLMKNGDVFDIFTPLVLIPLYWLLFRRSQPPAGRVILFVLLAGLWAEGQGMHLSANSIGHLLQESAGSDAMTLTEFYDEVLSHYLWHIGMLGLATLILVQNWPERAENLTVQWPAVAAAVLHGLTYALTILEANTGPIGIPFAAVVVLLCLVRGRERFRHNGTLAFFFTAFLIACLFFAGWCIYWGYCPEPSKVGLID